jgi:hypothetical protein
MFKSTVSYKNDFSQYSIIDEDNYTIVNIDFIEYVYDGDYDVLNFIGSLEKTIEVTFDPPDGYLDPKTLKPI